MKYTINTITKTEKKEEQQTHENNTEKQEKRVIKDENKHRNKQ